MLWVVCVFPLKRLCRFYLCFSYFHCFCLIHPQGHVHSLFNSANNTRPLYLNATCKSTCCNTASLILPHNNSKPSVNLSYVQGKLPFSELMLQWQLEVFKMLNIISLRLKFFSVCQNIIRGKKLSALYCAPPSLGHSNLTDNHHIKFPQVWKESCYGSSFFCCPLATPQVAPMHL